MQSWKYPSRLTSEKLLLGVDFLNFFFTKGTEQEINERLILTHYAFYRSHCARGEQKILLILSIWRV